VELQKELFPFLDFRTGGLFEFIDASSNTEESDTDFDETTKTYFAELNLDTPLYTAGTAYRRRELNDSLTQKLSREEFTGLFRWRPVGFPLFDLDVDSTRTWNRDKTVDRNVDRLLFKSRYHYKGLAYDYSYTRNDSEEKFEDTGSLDQRHNAGVEYETDFFSDRLQLTGSSKTIYQTQKPHSDTDIERPASPPGIKFVCTNDLDPNTCADPDAVINIGMGGSIPPVSVGLSFGFPTEVNKVHVLLDAEESVVAAVAGLYDWTVSWSDDTDPDLATWNSFTEPAVRATYNILENRFEITFPRVDGARLIKVATFPEETAAGPILITGIRAFTTLFVSRGTEVEDFDQTVNLGLRWAVSDKTEASYEGYFRYRDTQPFDITRKALSNSVSLRHAFSPIFVATARALRSDSTETNRSDTTSHSYSASLTANYLDTLRQTLVYSGNHDEIRDGSSYANSVFLRTNADLYQGWSSNLDLGYSSRHRIEGGNVNSSIFRVSTNLDPNPRLRFVIDYRLSWNSQPGEPSWLDQSSRFQGFWVPVRTLSLFAAVRLAHNERNKEGLQVTQNYSIDWAPFPDGLLRFSLGYNRSVDARNDTISALSPRIDWRVTRNTLLSLVFNLGTAESNQETRDVKNIRLTLRTYY
jgi:hypothetical protein